MKELKKESTWGAAPSTDIWNTESNWDPSNVPSTKAIFSKSTQTVISFLSKKAVKIENIEFLAEAPSFTFQFDSNNASPALTIEGDGIINNSAKTQSFIVASTGVHYFKPRLKFANFATAGGRNMSYYAGPETLNEGYGGGIIGFFHKATAGSATFTVRTGAMRPPKKNSTVGAEVSFNDFSSAGTAIFTIYGTLGIDGDTFGNIGFHDNASADHGTFINIGGTVHKGDGGNTQFYDNSNSGNGIFINCGGTFEGSNGGDVAFDGNATGENGHFHNRVAEVTGANGGVTSFNNNPPEVEPQGASAGNGFYHNYGAIKDGQGGGGHTEFTAKHGSPTAAYGNFFNYGSAIINRSSAGHTIFSVNINAPSEYRPTAGNAVFYNYPGLVEGAAAGFTEFAIYSDDDTSVIGTNNFPTAGNATFINIGGNKSNAAGGYTSFSGNSSAGNATLIANGGNGGGNGGRIVFYEKSIGDGATVQLYDNGELDISQHNGELNIAVLELTGGLIRIPLGNLVTNLILSLELILKSTQASFSFSKKGSESFKLNTPYTVLTAPNLSNFKADQFTGNSLYGVQPTFTIMGHNLLVSFNED